VSEPIRIDKRKALSLISKAVKARGADYVYPSDGGRTGCHYVWKGEPDCIVGQCLADAGVSIYTLKGMSGTIDDEAGTNTHAFILTAGALAVFDAAQHVQDDRATWGDAQSAAKAV
jgi:hypothetical protein